MVCAPGLLISSEGIRGLGVTSHPNPVASATRICLEGPTDTDSCRDFQPVLRVSANWPMATYSLDVGSSPRPRGDTIDRPLDLG